jgi:hypothetical protein
MEVSGTRETEEGAVKNVGKEASNLPIHDEIDMPVPRNLSWLWLGVARRPYTASSGLTLQSVTVILAEKYTESVSVPARIF